MSVARLAKEAFTNAAYKRRSQGSLDDKEIRKSDSQSRKSIVLYLPPTSVTDGEFPSPGLESPLFSPAITLDDYGQEEDEEVKLTKRYPDPRYDRSIDVVAFHSRSHQPSLSKLLDQNPTGQPDHGLYPHKGSLLDASPVEQSDCSALNIITLPEAVKGNLFLNWPLSIRQNVYKLLLPEEDRKISLCEKTATREVFDDDFFARFSEIRRPSHRIRATCKTMAAEFEALFWSRYKFHFTINHFTELGNDTMYGTFFKHIHLVQHLTIELDYTRFAFSKLPGAWRLTPDISNFETCIEKIVNGLLKRKDSIAFIHLMCRRWYGRREIEDGETDLFGNETVEYCPAKYLRSVEAFKPLKNGKVGALRMSGFTKMYTADILRAMYGENPDWETPTDPPWPPVPVPEATKQKILRSSVLSANLDRPSSLVMHPQFGQWQLHHNAKAPRDENVSENGSISCIDFLNEEQVPQETCKQIPLVDHAAVSRSRSVSRSEKSPSRSKMAFKKIKGLIPSLMMPPEYSGTEKNVFYGTLLSSPKSSRGRLNAGMTKSPLHRDLVRLSPRSETNAANVPASSSGLTGTMATEHDEDEMERYVHRSHSTSKDRDIMNRGCGTSGKSENSASVGDSQSIHPALRIGFENLVDTESSECGETEEAVFFDDFESPQRALQDSLENSVYTESERSCGSKKSASDDSQSIHPALRQNLADNLVDTSSGARDETEEAARVDDVEPTNPTLRNPRENLMYAGRQESDGSDASVIVDDPIFSHPALLERLGNLVRNESGRRRNSERPFSVANSLLVTLGNCVKTFDFPILATALRSFSSGDSRDLELASGDLIVVTGHVETNEEHWYGRIGSREGHFPKTVVRTQPVLLYGIALFPYSSPFPVGGCGLSEGDRVAIMALFDDGFAYGLNLSTGEYGDFQQNYVHCGNGDLKTIAKPGETLARVVVRSFSTSDMQDTSVFEPGDQIDVLQYVDESTGLWFGQNVRSKRYGRFLKWRVHVLPENPIELCRVTAITNYKRDPRTEIVFRGGDEMIVIDYMGRDFWYGKCIRTQQCGLIPVSCVKIIKENYPVAPVSNCDSHALRIPGPLSLVSQSNISNGTTLVEKVMDSAQAFRIPTRAAVHPGNNHGTLTGLTTECGTLPLARETNAIIEPDSGTTAELGAAIASGSDFPNITPRIGPTLNTTDASPANIAEMNSAIDLRPGAPFMSIGSAESSVEDTSTTSKPDMPIATTETRATTAAVQDAAVISDMDNLSVTAEPGALSTTEPQVAIVTTEPDRPDPTITTEPDPATNTESDVATMLDGPFTATELDAAFIIEVEDLTEPDAQSTPPRQRPATNLFNSPNEAISMRTPDRLESLSVQRERLDSSITMAALSDATNKSTKPIVTANTIRSRILCLTQNGLLAHTDPSKPSRSSSIRKSPESPTRAIRKFASTQALKIPPNGLSSVIGDEEPVEIQMPISSSKPISPANVGASSKPPVKEAWRSASLRVKRVTPDLGSGKDEGSALHRRPGILAISTSNPVVPETTEAAVKSQITTPLGRFGAHLITGSPLSQKAPQTQSTKGGLRPSSGLKEHRGKVEDQSKQSSSKFLTAINPLPQRSPRTDRPIRNPAIISTSVARNSKNLMDASKRSCVTAADALASGFSDMGMERSSIASLRSIAASQQSSQTDNSHRQQLSESKRPPVTSRQSAIACQRESGSPCLQKRPEAEGRVLSGQSLTRTALTRGRTSDVSSPSTNLKKIATLIPQRPRLGNGAAKGGGNMYSMDGNPGVSTRTSTSESRRSSQQDDMGHLTAGGSLLSFMETQRVAEAKSMSGKGTNSSSSSRGK